MEAYLSPLIHISLKNYRPLYETRALAVYMCAGLSKRPSIFASTVVPTIQRGRGR